ALDPTDDQQPRTQNYSFTVAQRVPWKSLLEIAYVGSKSDYLSNYNNNFDKINDLPVGAMFTSNHCGPDGRDVGQPCPWSVSGNYDARQRNVTRPFFATPGPCPDNIDPVTQLPKPCGYGDGLKIIDRKMYSNYNSLQVTWNKQ